MLSKIGEVSVVRKLCVLKSKAELVAAFKALGERVLYRSTNQNPTVSLTSL